MFSLRDAFSVLFAVTLLGGCESVVDKDGGTPEGSRKQQMDSQVKSGRDSGGASTLSRGLPSLQSDLGGDYKSIAGLPLDMIYFETNSSELSSVGKKVMSRLADILKGKMYLNGFPISKIKRIVVEGHTDERGTRQYNLALGMRRAGSARSFLLSKGIDKKVDVISFGKERPFMAESNEGAWKMNRRATVRFFDVNNNEVAIPSRNN